MTDDTRRAVGVRVARTWGLTLSFGACALSPSTSRGQAPSAPRPAGAFSDIEYLASRRLQGRKFGTESADTAALFIARRYVALGIPGAIAPVCDTLASCPPAYFQPFTYQGERGMNVVAVVPGTDSILRHEFVVVGAHYDHLGFAPERTPRRPSATGTRGVPGARAARDTPVMPDTPGTDALHPGADDNASGTAAVLALAERIAADRPRRSVLFAHFAAEEPGMIGSGVFVDHPPVPIVGITFMLNLDMVGRLGDRPLIVDAAHATAAARALVDSLFTALALPFRIEAETSDRSDHASFGRVRVPAISLFTGYHPDYHTPGDTPQRIDIAGLERVIAVAELLVRAVADRPGRFGSSP